MKKVLFLLLCLSQGGFISAKLSPKKVFIPKEEGSSFVPKPDARGGRTCTIRKTKEEKLKKTPVIIGAFGIIIN